MEMTFRQYIDNPLGKRNAVFSQRDMYKNLYTDKFDKLLLREAGKIDFALYYDDNRGNCLLCRNVREDHVLIYHRYGTNRISLLCRWICAKS